MIREISYRKVQLSPRFENADKTKRANFAFHKAILGLFCKATLK